MANQIKSSGADGLALQVTKPARSGGFVEEDDDGDATSLADEVRVFAFDSLLLVIDLNAVSTAQTSELVAAATRDTESIYRAMDASVQIAGHGYQVQLPPAEDAGFSEDDRAPCSSAPGLLLIARDDSTSTGAAASRLAQDIATLRREQIA